MRSVPEKPVVAERDIGLEKVVFNSRKAAVDGVFWGGMAALLDSALDSGPGLVGVREPEEALE